MTFPLYFAGAAITFLLLAAFFYFYYGWVYIKENHLGLTFVAWLWPLWWAVCLGYTLYFIISVALEMVVELFKKP